MSTARVSMVGSVMNACGTDYRDSVEWFDAIGKQRDGRSSLNRTIDPYAVAT